MSDNFTAKEIMTRLEQKVDKALDDHETRIRLLERWKYALPASVISGVFGATIAFFGVAFPRQVTDAAGAIGAALPF